MVFTLHGYTSQTRRKLGHRQGEWTAEINEEFLMQIDTDENGKIEREEFVQHFDGALPQDKEVLGGLQ